MCVLSANPSLHGEVTRVSRSQRSLHGTGGQEHCQVGLWREQKGWLQEPNYCRSERKPDTSVPAESTQSAMPKMHSSVISAGHVFTCLERWRGYKSSPLTYLHISAVRGLC